MSSYVWLMGGLGNQLFQANFGYKLLASGSRVSFNSLLVKRNAMRFVTRFNIHPFELHSLIKDCPIHTAFNAAPFLAKPPIFNRYSQWFGTSGIPICSAKNYFGYFQDKRDNKQCWFQDLVTLTDAKRYDVALHLRYTDSPHLVRSMEVKKILKRFSSSFEIAILTDDKEKAGKLVREVGLSNIDFPQGGLLDDFSIIAKAPTVICADSTFSWWAAKLNQNAELVIAPQNLVSRLGVPNQRAQARVFG